MKRFSIFFITSLLLISQQGMAKTNKAAKKAPEVQGVGMVLPELPLNNDEEYAKFIKEIKQSPRSTATAITDVPAIEKTFEKDFLMMREELIGNGQQGDKNEKGVTSVEQLDQIINKYSDQATYNSLSNQAKFLALQLRSLKPFKSFIFRAKSYIGGISATRTMIVTALRAQIAGIQTFFPLVGNASVNHWEVVFNYITQNTPGMGTEILTDEHLYVFFTNLAYDYSKIVEDFGKIVKDDKPIWWDNKLYMSFASFASEKDRYILLGRPELYSLYSAALVNASTLASTTAYSFQGLRASIKSIGELFGVDNFVDGVKAQVTGRGADGMSSYTRIKVLKEHPELFKRTKDGKARMDYAYKMLVSAARAARISYEETKKLPKDSQNLFDSRIANAFNRIGGTSFNNIDQLIDETEPVSSAVINGDRVKVSLRNFYLNPPEHLNELYPTNWDLSSEGQRVDVPDYKKEGQYLRNYKYGMATEWKLEPFKKIFPELTGYEVKLKPSAATNITFQDVVGKTELRTKDVPKFARILSQTWGSSVFAIPLGAAIF